jgi:hypothetical protein
VTYVETMSDSGAIKQCFVIPILSSHFAHVLLELDPTIMQNERAG